MRNVAIGQAGGPTSVINSTLSGLTKELSGDYSLYYVKDGYGGLVENNLIKVDEKMILKLNKYTYLPGAFLGSGRYELSKENLSQIVFNMKEKQIETLVFIGGNGTMKALHKISYEAKRQNYDLQVIGIPKTVDNDIYYIDHSPGFGSAAKYVAYATRDLSLDLASMKNFEQVRVVETMGRNAGWLAAASGFLKRDENEGPHFIALPERPLNKERLLETVENSVKENGYATVVVSEGVLWDDDTGISFNTFNNRTVLGGVSQKLSHFIGEETNLNVRAENLGMLQRCFSKLISETDKKEAFLVGIEGGKYVRLNKSDVVVSIDRVKQKQYEMKMEPIPLEKVVRHGERLMPDKFIDNLEEYYEWLSPIID